MEIDWQEMEEAVYSQSFYNLCLGQQTEPNEARKNDEQSNALPQRQPVRITK